MSANSTMMNNRKTLLPPRLMLLLAPVLWSTSNVIGKLAVGLMTEFQFTFYRWLFAAILMTIFCWKVVKKDLPELKKRALWLFFWGGSAFALFNIVLYGGINMGVKLVNIAIIFALIPALVLILNAIIFKERAHPLQWLGVAATVFGVIWLVTGGTPQTLLGWRPSLAEGFVLIAALIYVGYSVVLRQAPNVHWMSLMWAMCVSAMLVSLPFYLWETAKTEQLLIPVAPTTAEIMKALALVAYVTVFVAILSKMFYMEGVIVLGASRGALVMNLLPVFNTLAALLIFRDERAVFGAVQLTALLWVVGGILSSEIGATLK
ncbi:DMT family transporter [Suttonella ornithocola]|uniref:Predicted permease, DMT superfamily n=1 Tax=Suttonella ornithocola TaxID=279832 RepID=A0A380MTU6_9GAMM|nr:DMT family transporter [Suttonella ornithocola]SUO95141.1 Predicted permease, DMT superfamily [Suttonella ornithocola]